MNIRRIESKPQKRRRAFTLIELLVVISIISILAAILFPVFARARENARKAACMSNLKQIGLAVMMYVQDYDETYPVGRFGVTGNISYWYDVLQTYTKSQQVFICPTAGPIEDSDGNILFSGGYGWNMGGRRGPDGTGYNGFGYMQGDWRTPSNSGPMKIAAVEEAASTILIADPASNGHNYNGRYAVGYSNLAFIPTLHGGQIGPFTGGQVTVPPGGGGNYIFADGHVKWLAQSQSFNKDLWNVEKGHSPK